MFKRFCGSPRSNWDFLVQWNQTLWGFTIKKKCVWENIERGRKFRFNFVGVQDGKKIAPMIWRKKKFKIGQIGLGEGKAQAFNQFNHWVQLWKDFIQKVTQFPCDWVQNIKLETATSTERLILCYFLFEVITGDISCQYQIKRAVHLSQILRAWQKGHKSGNKIIKIGSAECISIVTLWHQVHLAHPSAVVDHILTPLPSPSSLHCPHVTQSCSVYAFVNWICCICLHNMKGIFFAHFHVITAHTWHTRYLSQPSQQLVV